MESGLALGRIAEKVARDPALLPQAIEFYAECAGAEELAQTVRALCLARYRHHSGIRLPPGESPIPEAVVRLARQAKFR